MRQKREEELKIVMKKRKRKMKMKQQQSKEKKHINPLNAQLNPICHLLALLGVHHILHVSRISVKEK